MTMKKKSGGDYEVGFGKPPKETRFQKGQSGNPSGKSKKEVSLKAELTKILEGEAVVTKAGVQMSMSHLAIMLQALVNKAMKGDLPAIKFVAEQSGTDFSDLPTPAQYTLTEADFQAMNTHANWLGLIEQGQAEMGTDNDGEEDDKPAGDF